MTVKSCEKLEKSRVALTIETSAEEFEAAVNKAYLKMRGKINVPGFRVGKAPRKIIEKMYGAEVFYEEAVNIILPDAYEAAVKEQELDVVGYPEVELESCTKDGVVFNNVWGIRKIPRKLYKRFGFYIIVLALSPLLVFVFSAGIAFYTNITNLFGLDLSNIRSITKMLGYLGFYTVSTLTFSAMFTYIPATKVKYRYGLQACQHSSWFSNTSTWRRRCSSASSAGHTA